MRHTFINACIHSDRIARLILEYRTVRITTYLLSYLSHRRYRRSIEIVVILSGLNEQVILYVSFHLLPRRHEVIIPTVHLVFSSTPRRVCEQNSRDLVRERVTLLVIAMIIYYRRSVDSRGTQLPNLSGNSEMRSSLMRSLSGPRTMTGRVYCIVSCCTASYESTFSSLPVIVRSNVHPIPTTRPRRERARVGGGVGCGVLESLAAISHSIKPRRHNFAHST